MKWRAENNWGAVSFVNDDGEPWPMDARWADVPVHLSAGSDAMQRFAVVYVEEKFQVSDHGKAYDVDSKIPHLSTVVAGVAFRARLSEFDDVRPVREETGS